MCLPRTNNYCESWQNSFTKMISNHPIIYNLVYALILEQNRVEAKIVQLRTGIVYRRRPEDIVEDDRLQHLISNYDSDKKLIFFNFLLEYVHSKLFSNIDIFECAVDLLFIFGAKINKGVDDSHFHSVITSKQS
ncbi:unnamed protein product [Brachionus calyciflorus]|uniref:Uncharacterized protein n=1 Tax=Brachionus calyciflorus TaxID=104777 RepID=A0A814EXG9_9BILA|nr:unnamed protein product [Brachionus calyciflorus]